MSKIDALLNARLVADKDLSKVKALAKQSADGSLTSFSGLFKVGELSDREKLMLETLLQDHKEESADIQKDLKSLIAITSEVKAIQNQAALLHGERIKRVQTMLKSYKEGAFTAWLMAAYGNRQTPYNFLLYFEFCEGLPSELKQKVEAMPRQAVYTLASRQVSPQKKQEIVASYSGETKREMLEIIRSSFPLERDDKRRADEGQAILTQLVSLFHSYKRLKNEISDESRQDIKNTLSRFMELLQDKR
jgi:hypothetical protein